MSLRVSNSQDTPSRKVYDPEQANVVGVGSDVKAVVDDNMHCSRGSYHTGNEVKRASPKDPPGVRLLLLLAQLARIIFPRS